MAKKDSSVRPDDRPEYREALQRAAAFCSRQETYTRHIREKLSEWGVSENDAEKVLSKLKEEKFLDDRRYALAFAREKFRLNRWGRMKISYMLRMKGIQDEVIGEAVFQFDEDQYAAACRELIRAKSSGMKEKNPWTRKAKLQRFATSRGFESDLVFRLLDSLDDE